MTKLNSIDQLIKVAEKGYHVRCKDVSYLEKFVKAEALLAFSVRSIKGIIDKGLEVKELKEADDLVNLFIKGR